MGTKIKKDAEKIILEPRRKFDYTPDPKQFYDLIVIGAGVSGLATAMYGKRLGLKTLVIGNLIGGTVTLTEVIENYPGFISIDGPEFGRLMENHAKDYDIDIVSSMVQKIEIHKKSEKRHFKVFTKSKGDFFAKTIVVATGTAVRKLGVRGEGDFEGKGVSYCALCDGPFFRGKTLSVVGGSDSAVKEAILLTKYAKKVYIIYRKEKPHPEEQTQKKLDEKIKQGKIEIIPNTNILEIKGDAFMNKVIFDKPYKGEKEFLLEGLFVYIGRIPLNQVIKGLKIKLNKLGEIIINKNSETNIKGIYAAGDITDNEWKQAITGVAEGVKAAYYCYQYVSDNKFILPLKSKK